MSAVTLQVGGRPYTITCADGEEDHVHALARTVDEKLAAVGGNGAPGDVRNLLLAALILADELDEARRVPAPTPAAAPTNDAFTDNIARGLEALAERLEQVATALEKPGASA